MVEKKHNARLLTGVLAIIFVLNLLGIIFNVTNLDNVFRNPSAILFFILANLLAIITILGYFKPNQLSFYTGCAFFILISLRLVVDILRDLSVESAAIRFILLGVYLFFLYFLIKNKSYYFG